MKSFAQNAASLRNARGSTILLNQATAFLPMFYLREIDLALSRLASALVYDVLAG